MTPEELNQYNALSEEHKKLYKRLKSEHPDWSYDQIIFKLVIISEPLCGDINMGGMPDDESLWDKIKNVFR